MFQQRAVGNDYLLETGKRNLQEYFQSKGYYDASVDFKGSAGSRRKSRKLRK